MRACSQCIIFGVPTLVTVLEDWHSADAGKKRGKALHKSPSWQAHSQCQLSSAAGTSCTCCNVSLVKSTAAADSACAAHGQIHPGDHGHVMPV